jgi:hypothetical protein
LQQQKKPSVASSVPHETSTNTAVVADTKVVETAKDNVRPAPTPAATTTAVATPPAVTSSNAAVPAKKEEVAAPSQTPPQASGASTSANSAATPATGSVSQNAAPKTGNNWQKNAFDNFVNSFDEQPAAKVSPLASHMANTLPKMGNTSANTAAAAQESANTYLDRFEKELDEGWNQVKNNLSGRFMQGARQNPEAFARSQRLRGMMQPQ